MIGKMAWAEPWRWGEEKASEEVQETAEPEEDFIF
jgi:hypothetical protein